MRKHIVISIFSGLALLLAMPLWLPGTHAHEGHEHFSAGEPGDPKKPARTIQVSMREDGKKMLYEPSRIEVRQGEQIRFVISNDGIYNHEFMLATVADNRKHGALMKKYPDMEHEDPNAVTVAPYVVEIGRAHV